MPLSERLRSFLDSHRVVFTLTTHPQAFTARDVAAAEHLSPREVAKTVVISGDGVYHMLVIPASRMVNLSEVRSALGFAHAQLATEEELGKLFPDCELGAMPPLGPMYGLEVYLDGSLAGHETITFNAGNHREVIHMRMADFRRLVSPEITTLVREPAASRH